MGRLVGKCAIVTGGGRGIGAGIARAFAAEGAAVMLVDRDPAAVRKQAAEIAKVGGLVVPFEADVTDEAEVSRMVEVGAEALGPIDILVNNAGFARHGTAAEMTLREWREVVDGNLEPVFLCSRAVLGEMIERQTGCILNLGSQLGFLGAATMTHY